MIDRLFIRKDWANEGRSGKRLGPDVEVGGQSWTPIFWDGEEDPDWHKTAGLRGKDWFYCGGHLTVHQADYCSLRNPCGTELLAESEEAAFAEARSRGLCFYDDDVVNLRDSATDPKVGDVVGDPKHKNKRGCYSRVHLRRVLAVSKDSVEWGRWNGSSHECKCSRKAWRRWAKGGERVDSTGMPVRSTRQRDQ